MWIWAVQPSDVARAELAADNARKMALAATGLGAASYTGLGQSRWTT